MRKGMILLIMVLLCVKVLSAQEYHEVFDSLDVAKVQVVYKLTYKEDSLRRDIQHSERMVLLIGKTMSYFGSFKQYQREHLEFPKCKEGDVMAWMNTAEEMKYRFRWQYKVYKNYPQGNLTYIDHIFLGNSIQYQEDLKVLQWEIFDDTLSVENYLCHKAVCHYGGRKWEAWFTEELPFDDGPYKFCGLHGLILKVADARGDYNFEFLSIEVPSAVTNIEWYNGLSGGVDCEKTTREKFLKAQRDSREDVMNRFEERTNLAVQKKAFYAMKARNNPIELE